MGPFAQLLQLPRHLVLDLGRNLVLRQGLQLPLCLPHCGSQILGGSVGFSKHFAAFTNRRLQSIGFGHQTLLAVRWVGVVPTTGSAARTFVCGFGTGSGDVDLRFHAGPASRL